MKVGHELSTYLSLWFYCSFIHTLSACICICICMCLCLCVRIIHKPMKENNTMRLKRKEINDRASKRSIPIKMDMYSKVKCIAVLSVIDIRGLCFILIQRHLDPIHVYSILFLLSHLLFSFSFRFLIFHLLALDRIVCFVSQAMCIVYSQFPLYVDAM